MAARRLEPQRVPSAVAGRRRRGAASAVLVAAVAAALALPGPADAASSHDVDLLIRTSAAAPARSAVAAAAPGLEVRALRRLGPHVAVVTVRGAGTASSAASALEASPLVARASADRRLSIAGATSPAPASSAAFAAQWDLWDSASTRRAGGYGVDAPRAWTRTLGSPDVVVAVLDTGITQHPDLAGASIASGYDFVTGGDGIGTGDGDGWDADPTDPGDACADSGEGDSWHGTFVAGELVAQHGATATTAGAAPGVTLLPVRVLGACGGTESDSIAAIEWATGGTVPGVPDNPRPASVVSMSLGGAEGACSAALQTAIDDARSRGAVVVAAAGNDGQPVARVSPANCRGVISVAATTRAGALAAYSNRGSASLAPVLAAPGGSAAAPVIGDGWDDGRPVAVRAAGTSMAAPRVAAAAALLRSVEPGLPPDEVQRRLTDTATRFPSRGGCVPAVCGAGIVNLGNLLGSSARFVHVDRAAVTGVFRTGGRVRARAGSWRPAATSTRYQWLRDGRPLPGATGRAYTLRASDAGHRVSVRVRVARPGTTTASAVSSAHRVARAR